MLEAVFPGKTHPPTSHTQTKERDMKIKNIALVGGIMSLFLGLNGSAHADGTVIASQAYVDAKVSSIDMSTKQDALSTAQLNAVNSGITSAKVSQHDAAYTATNGATSDNVIATSTANTNLLKANGLQGGVLHMHGVGAAGYVGGVENSSVATVGIQNSDVITNASVQWDTIFSGKKGDDYVPTVGSVEARITRKLAGLSLVQDSITDGVTDKAPSQNAVYDALAGKVTKNSNITAKNNSIVNYDAKGLVTGGIVLEDVSGDGLTGVNGEAKGSNGCSAAKPCILTYLGGTGANALYRWSPMDTDSISAQ